MLQVHLTNGRTLHFDLENQAQVCEWISKAREPAFQTSISGLSLLYAGVQYSFPRPIGFRRIWLFAENMKADGSRKFKGGERITGQVDHIRATIMVHKGQRAVRIGLTNPGTQCYNPVMELRRGGNNGVTID